MVERNIAKLGCASVLGSLEGSLLALHYNIEILI
jgi:hypothetical protein